jgi:hypothetical protein
MINFIGRNSVLANTISRFLFCEDDNATLSLVPQNAARTQFNVARMWMIHKDGTRDLARDENGYLMLQFRFPGNMDNDDVPLILHECVHVRQLKLGRLSMSGMGEGDGTMPVKFDGKTFYRGNQYYQLIRKYDFSWKTWKENKHFWADLKQYYPWEFEAWSVEAAYRSGANVDFTAIGRKQDTLLAA